MTGEIIPQNIFLLIILVITLLPGISAILIMKFNFNIAPDLKAGAVFVIKGPYKYIRHPMYFTVIFSLLCLVIYDYTLIRLIVFMILLIDLLVKMNYEEGLLGKEFEGYQEYKLKTKRIIPFIY